MPIQTISIGSMKSFPKKYSSLLPLHRGIWLLAFVRSCIETTLGKKPLVSAVEPFLVERNYGVFITLRKNGKLRGCFGTPYPTKPLLETIQEITIESALEDSRFPSIIQEEFSQIQIELSILTPPRPIEVEKIQIGIHGLILSQNNKAALFLPDIAIEKGWNVITFLQQLCLKAGLPQNAWKKGAHLAAFQTQVFREE
jgi:AmmeMemoRadiSam system protein A